MTAMPFRSRVTALLPALVVVLILVVAALASPTADTRPEPTVVPLSTYEGWPGQ